MSNNSVAFWDKTWKRENDRFYQHFENIADLLPEGVKRVIDVGCGTGTLLYFLRTKFNGLDVQGRDHSSVAIRKLRHRGLIGKVEKLPRISGKADVCIATEVVEHMKDDVRLLKNMAKCAPVVIITVPNNRLGPEECDEHERLYTAESLGKLLDPIFSKYVIYEAGLYLLAKAIV